MARLAQNRRGRSVRQLPIIIGGPSDARHMQETPTLINVSFFMWRLSDEHIGVDATAAAAAAAAAVFYLFFLSLFSTLFYFSFFLLSYTLSDRRMRVR
jgi:hypothetical protein